MYFHIQTRISILGISDVEVVGFQGLVSSRVLLGTFWDLGSMGFQKILSRTLSLCHIPGS